MITRKPLNSGEMRIIRKTILEKTGFVLKDYLIEQVFTRSSYSKRYGGGSNENLEYAGDTVIGYYTVKKLYDHYGTIHKDDEINYVIGAIPEEDLKRLDEGIEKAQKAVEEILRNAAVMDEWDLCRFLIVGQQDIDNNVDKQEKIKADLFEAIIGAIAVQVQWNKEILEEVISKTLPIEEMILKYEKERYRTPQFSAQNAVSTLKELAEREECDFPIYDIKGPEWLGYTSNGKPRWNCNIRIPGSGISLGVMAHSKKDAKKYAAYLALGRMFELPNEYWSNKIVACWEFDGQRLFPNPESDF
mgnify:CR=1 FL=1